jgi:hypothetical protein
VYRRRQRRVGAARTHEPQLKGQSVAASGPLIVEPGLIEPQELSRIVCLEVLTHYALFEHDEKPSRTFPTEEVEAMMRSLWTSC